MALPPLDELRGGQRDGTAQRERARPEVAPGAIGIDERTPAELLRFVRRFAAQLYWYGPDNRPGGWWADARTDGDAGIPLLGEPPRDGPAFFDGLGPGGIGWDEVAAFAANPAAFPGDRYAPLRRPHMALLLTAVRLLRHGQRAVNGIVERHFDWQLRDLLGLVPKPPQPDRAFVLFELAPNIAAAEVADGLRLLGGRDSRRRDRIYAIEDGLTVNRARVAQLRSTFVDRDVIGLADARRAITDTPEKQLLFLLAIAYGDPAPGDPLPPLHGAPLSQARLTAIGDLVAFAPTGLFMDLFELRALIARKARRAREAADWARVNGFIETAGRNKRGDPAWTLAPADPAAFHANFVKALQGEPDLGGLPEVGSIEDLAMHLDDAAVRVAIRDKLYLDPLRQFAPMFATKRAIDADWTIINGYLERAGKRRRPADPGWTLQAARQGDFAANFAAAIGPVDYAAAGTEAAGVTSLDDYMARIAEIEDWFRLPAEDIARLIAAFGANEATAAGAAAWRGAYDLLAGAHGRIVRRREAAVMAAVRTAVPRSGDGLAAEMTAALGELADDPAARLEALGRYVSPDDVAVVAAALGPGRRGAIDWDAIDAILADARRRRLRLPDPVAQKQHWRALFAWPDARTATIGGEAATAWHCFGGVPPDAGPDRPPAGIGWAIASPMLDLSTGRRRIILSLGFHDDGGGPLIDDHGDSPAKLPFVVTLSGAKGWMEPSSVAFATVNYAAVQGVAPVDPAIPLIGLEVTITLDETAPAPAPAPAAAGFDATPWPALRLMLRPVWDNGRRRFDTAYERFGGLRLARVNIAAAVGGFVADGAPGLWPLAVETETGVANGKKPFEPFGPTPSVGSELAIGHRDLLHKNLTLVSLGLEWLGGPANLATWYARYDARSFVAQLSLVDGVRTTALLATAALFAGTDGTAAQKIGRIVATAAPADAVPSSGAAEVRSWRRYLTLRLAGTDFGHRVYPSLATSTAIALANALRTPGSTVDPAAFTVNPPYTPKLKRLTLDFAAQQEIDLARYDPRGIDRLYHIDAFGTDAARASDRGWPLLPPHDEEGALYIGLTGVAAPQSLSLLFAAVDSGSAASRAGPVDWAYLDANGWTPFPVPPADGTDGLTRRGIIRFALPPVVPAATATADTRMPGGLYWLRATMASGAMNAGDMLDIHAQAAAARFIDDGAAPEHYLAPLPPGTIRTLVDPAAGIARAVQPYASQDGRPAEGEAAFRARAGERLRHKHRALTVWDYERLVLERFPDVHTVKCLPARFADGLGHVRLVIIPDIRGQQRADPFAPRAPARLLDAIADYLAPLAPPAARITAGHARFVAVRVRVGVRFRPGGDEAFDTQRLSRQIDRYLAPWAFDDGADIAIGQRIDATSIVALIDLLPFVDFVGGCRLFVSTDDGASFHPGGDGSGDWAEAAGEDGVLTPSGQHEIDVIAGDVFEQTQFTGIGYMKVELDFVVG